MIWQIQQFLAHQWRAQGNHLLHSPFAFTFYQEVLRQPNPTVVAEIEAFVKKIYTDSTPIQRTDLGAGPGGKGGGSHTLTLGQTVRRSARKRKEGGLLHRVMAHYQPQRVLELGTHVGISALYQGTALSSSAQMHSVEGDPILAKIAKKHLEEWGLNQISVHTGAFDEVLEALQLSQYQPDYVLIDGDHRLIPTQRYVQALLPHMPDGSLIIFDDIYWSREMGAAWAWVKAQPDITVTIDVFSLGFAWVRRSQEKQDFHFRF